MQPYYSSINYTFLKTASSEYNDYCSGKGPNDNDYIFLDERFHNAHILYAGIIHNAYLEYLTCIVLTFVITVCNKIISFLVAGVYAVL